MLENYEFEESPKSEEQTTHEIEMETRVLAPIELGFSGAGAGASGGGVGDGNGHGGGGGGPKFRELCKLAGATEEQARLLSRLGSSLSSGKGDVLKAIGEQLSSGQMSENGLREIGNALKNSIDSKYSGIAETLHNLLNGTGTPDKLNLAPDGTLKSKNGASSGIGSMAKELQNKPIENEKVTPAFPNPFERPVVKEIPEGLLSRIADQVRAQEAASKFAKLIDDKGQFKDEQKAASLLRDGYRSGHLDKFQDAVNAQLRKNGSAFTFEADDRFAGVQDIGWVTGKMKSGKDTVSTCGYTITNWFGTDPPPEEHEHPRDRR